MGNAVEPPMKRIELIPVAVTESVRKEKPELMVLLSSVNVWLPSNVPVPFKPE